MTEADVVRLTDRAAGKIRGLLEKEDMEGRSLRLTVVRTHCMMGRGHGYALQLAGSREDGDESVERDGVTLLVDPASAGRLRGTEIDYAESLESSGFTFANPNSTGKCPCGHHELFD